MKPIAVLIILFLHLINLENNSCKDIELVRQITLDESIHLIGNPIITIDEQNNFILTDMQLNNVKIYDSNGEFEKLFGQKGRGPGDLDWPVYSIVHNKKLYTVQLDGKLTIWDLKTEKLDKVLNLPLFFVTKFMFYDESHLIVNGKPTGTALNESENNILHLVDIESNTIVKSFFNMPDNFIPWLPAINSFPEISNFTITDSGISTNFGVGTQIYKYDRQFDIMNTYEIDITKYFKSILDYEFTEITSNRTNFTTSFSRINQLFNLTDKEYIIQIRRDIKYQETSNRFDGIHHILYVNISSGNVCHLQVNGTLSFANNGELFLFDDEKRRINKHKLN
jgi:hypothetical protein